MRNATRHALVAGSVLLVLGISGCGSDEQAAPPTGPSPSAAPSARVGTPVLELDFDDLEGGSTALAGGDLQLANRADQDVTMRVSAVGGGQLATVPDPDGGLAARFPEFSDEGGRVVVTATAVGLEDPLGPGNADFSFGARFSLDAQSDGGTLDNGNNLVQRGLSADPVQYKIQIDKGQASCRVAGEDGEVLVTSPEPIEPDTWYAVLCSRTGDTVTIEVAEQSDDEPAEDAERTSGTGATGAIFLPEETPLAIGGKTGPTGEAVEGNSDQFNGAIDDVFLSIAAQQ